MSQALGTLDPWRLGLSSPRAALFSYTLGRDGDLGTRSEEWEGWAGSPGFVMFFGPSTIMCWAF